MAILGNLPAFSNLADVRSSAIDGWMVYSGTAINMLGGDDVISGSGSAGILVGGLLDAGAGNDTLDGSGPSGIFASGTIAGGLGNDSLTGTGLSYGIWLSRGVIDTGAGHDIVRGFAISPTNPTGYWMGIWNSDGIIDTGIGDDQVIGVSLDSGTGIYNGNTITSGRSGIIRTGAGNDTISGSGGNGIMNVGLIDSGEGADLIKATAIGTGIMNEVSGVILLGGGNDTISGGGGRRGINLNMSTIDCGSGNDLLVGTGSSFGIDMAASTIQGGMGFDTIQGFGGEIGIYMNGGLIDLGTGNDVLTASGSICALVNHGLISCGLGMDTVDALIGGIQGTGVIDLGADADTLKGFGTGNFIGGTGLDKLLLPDGVYALSSALGTVKSGGTTMNISGFERVGGCISGIFPFASGTLQVVSGVAAFSP